VSRPRPHDPAPQRTDLRLGRIVRLLMENATVVASGTKIAEEIGTNRSEVWRLVQQLRSLGVEIAGHPATGYQLKAVPDLLLPDMLAPALKGTIFGADVQRNFHHYYKIGSTNIEAMESAAAGAPEGSAFVAEEQTAGRGRGAHRWESAASTGIYCSVVLRPPLPPSEALTLSLAAGLAVHAAVQQVDAHATPDLKWPNDLLINGKKFCGILTEMNAEPTRVRYIVVGIGINVNNSSREPDVAASGHARHSTKTRYAISLCEATNREHDLQHVLGAALRTLEARFKQLATSDQSLPVAWQRLCWLTEQGVEVKLSGKWIDGVCVGIDRDGTLLVENLFGTHRINSGSVRVL